MPLLAFIEFRIKFLPSTFSSCRRDGAVFEDLPQRDIEFADSISVLNIKEVTLVFSRSLRNKT